MTKNNQCANLSVEALFQDINDQQGFDRLMKLIDHPNRKIACRAIDVIEKLTLIDNYYLIPYQHYLVSLCQQESAIEIKWHLALLLPRLPLSEEEVGALWDVLTHWVLNRKESRIVRANSLQALCLLSDQYPALKRDFWLTVQAIEHEPIPSLQARLRQLQKRKTQIKGRHGTTNLK